MRERSRVSSRQRPSPSGKGDCKSRDPDLGRFLRLEPEESLPGTSETIPGCKKGEEESPRKEHSNHPGERSLPRTLLLSPATASSAEPGNPNSQRESRPVRSTSFGLLYLFPQSGQSLRRKRKREPYPCGSSSSCQTGQEVDACFGAGRAPAKLACVEPADNDPADPPAAAGFRGILGR